MGMEAELLAIGPYSEDVKDCLDYDRVYYKSTREGTPVIATPFSSPSL